MFWCGWHWGVEKVLLRVCSQILCLCQYVSVPEFQTLRTIPCKLHLPPFQQPYWQSPWSQHTLWKHLCCITQIFCWYQLWLCGWIGQHEPGDLVRLWLVEVPVVFSCWLISSFAGTVPEIFLFFNVLKHPRPVVRGWNFQVGFLSSVVTSEDAVMGLTHGSLAVIHW